MKLLFNNPSICLLLIFVSTSCAQTSTDQSMSDNNTLDTITFGAGCFWCVEAIFQELEGVESVISGYSGGHLENPTYDDIIGGKSGHAEVCQISFNPNNITFDQLLMVFWQTHDPTTLNRQGNDYGTQYRSAIFYHNEKQKTLAEEYKKKLDATGAWSNPIVTEITPFEKFYNADDYHQDYFDQNSEVPYCKFVIQPKLDKFRKAFPDRIKNK